MQSSNRTKSCIHFHFFRHCRFHYHHLFTILKKTMNSLIGNIFLNCKKKVTVSGASGSSEFNLGVGNGTELTEFLHAKKKLKFRPYEFLNPFLQYGVGGDSDPRNPLNTPRHCYELIKQI